MIARLIISPILQERQEKISKILSEVELTNPHPDLLFFPQDSKLGVLEAKKIKMHFSLKPYSAKGRAVVLEEAGSLTDQAQNALLKTLEELPEKGIIILGADSESKFLPTVLSRCQITRIQYIGDRVQSKKYDEDIEKLLTSNTEERFEYIEKLKERQEFLNALVYYFHKDLNVHPRGDHSDFLKELLVAEGWAEANVNIRAILEYLMLKMPS